MNNLDYRIMGLYEKIERNKKNQLNPRYSRLLVYFFCYCHGIKNLDVISKEAAIGTNIVWIISVIAVVGLYIKDSCIVRNSKSVEFEIYTLETENLNNKIEVAKIKGEVLPDYILNKQIAIPDEKVSFPIIYYAILLGLDVIIRISLFIDVAV
jgi:hypothetical protein